MKRHRIMILCNKTKKLMFKMPTKLQDQETEKMLPWQQLLPDIVLKVITYKLSSYLTSTPNLAKICKILFL